MERTSVALRPRYTVPKGGTLELIGRVSGWDKAPIVPNDIDTVHYSVFEINKTTGAETVIDGHDNVELDKDEVIMTSLQTDDRWEDRDTIGYNFVHTPPNRSNVPFPNRGKTYEVRYTLVPQDAALQNLVLAFEVLVQ